MFGLFIVMADELRWEQLTTSVPDGTVVENAGATFRNTTDATIFIREVDMNGVMTTASPNESGSIFLSKARTLVQGNNEPGYNLFLGLQMEALSALDVGSKVNQITKLYAKGALTLEPNEALFVNTSKTTGGQIASIIAIGYHF